MESIAPYLRLLPFDDHGWFFNAHQLEHALALYDVKTVIEVGSWLGKSTRFLASLPTVERVFAIDTWLGSPNELAHTRDPRVQNNTLYQTFLSNCIQSNLAHKIVPVRMTSLEAARALNVTAHLIYIDAAHDEKSVYDDIMAFWPKLLPGGTMCGDDWTWTTVRSGVLNAARDLNVVSIHPDGEFWKFSAKPGA